MLMSALLRSLVAQAHRYAPLPRLIAAKTCIPAGRILVRAGESLLLFPYRAERIHVPPPTDAGGTSVDVVDDLVGYTGLERGQVVALIHRRHENFRTEWHAFPPAVRSEAWFYLASRTYLFANAVHETAEIKDALAGFLADSSDVLDFGGGTGNLALALASNGHTVDFVERSALQKDFVRFRIEKHKFGSRLRVLDQWTPFESDAYDLVCAMDVLEHLDTLEETLASLLPAIRPSGTLAENSPFVRNIQNPMHHEGEAAFLHLMRREGFVCAHQNGSLRMWTRDTSGI
jgi:hypothetical protein